MNVIVILLLLLLSLSLILYVIIMQSIFMGVLYVIKNECREPLALRTAWSPWMRISEWSAARSGRIRWDRNGSTTGISRIGVMLVNGKCDFFIKKLDKLASGTIKICSQIYWNIISRSGNTTQKKMANG